MDDDLRQFAYATAIIETFGGYREVAWRLAGELVRGGVDAETVFLGLQDDSPLAERWSAAHGQYLPSQEV